MKPFPTKEEYNARLDSIAEPITKIYNTNPVVRACIAEYVMNPALTKEDTLYKIIEKLNDVITYQSNELFNVYMRMPPKPLILKDGKII